MAARIRVLCADFGSRASASVFVTAPGVFFLICTVQDMHQGKEMKYHAAGGG